MNLTYATRQLGLLMLVLSLSLFAVAALSLFDWMDSEVSEVMAVRAIVAAAVVGLIAGALMWWYGRTDDTFLGRREALLLVAASWLVGAVLAALPYWFWTWLEPGVEAGKPFHSPIACYFEAMSGLTTTGATVLGDIESVPHSLLLWRALTHWFGGVGIVVLFVAVLPNLGVGGKKLFQVEATGPKAEGVRPRIRETARVLWLIYMGLTIALALLLWAFGMSLFDAVCHTFATLATGGFSTRNASMGADAFNRPAIQITVIFFMLLAGVNFGLYYQLLQGKFRSVWTNPELRLYISIIAIASLFVCAGIYGSQIVTMQTHASGNGNAVVDGTLPNALHHGVFQVVAIITTTGFCTADFDQPTWFFIPQAVLMALMFVGASAGSTGGGVKIIRFLITFKVMVAEIERVFRPNVVRSLKIGKSPIPPEMRTGTLVYMLGIIVLFLLGTVLLMLLESGNNIDIATAASASASTLNNIGPGLGMVGATKNYGWFTDASKLVMCVLMALGRLEVYAIFVLFMPRFWSEE